MANYSKTMPLLLSLTRREITGRYRGSAFGLLWSLLTPLFMLAVYTFVFGFVMKSRWSVPSATNTEHSMAEFSVVLFSGLIVFQVFSEVLSTAPSLVLNNRNYVKKIVFPIHILPAISVGAALFHACVSLLVLLCFAGFVFGGIHLTVILAPVVIAPMAVMVLGVAWMLAAVGVYFRDIGLIVPPVLTATLFLSPVLFPRTALPVGLQPYLSLNPLAVPVESFRNVVIFGVQPNWTALGSYLLVSILVAVLGYQFFQTTRRGFADVL
ncbi:ABC transporter permease [Mesorhizobium humile]|uniref:Transport permease protein n=1 Tax=Mesorhizobium humile TaxID=3072313 RepID=A0ABU4YDI1_9HYPH|nr:MULTISPECIES: ABC transporter permease [unclassified Mesorhizobium]MDX8459209.1 ABC transporter permease [Mesorhizobium sp. VK2D]MDX8484992.1 ABC transporter permease [Mesorhizobium sp. VK2B]